MGEKVRRGGVLGSALLCGMLSAVGMVGLLSGCGSSSTVVSQPPPPPPFTEPNSCKATSTTSPAQPVPGSNVAGAGFTGVVKAGQQPVVGASVMVYAAGSQGNGAGAKALLGSLLTTDVQGAFSVAAEFTCPLSNTVLYAVATGGRVGSEGNNAALEFVTVLGTCESVAAGAAFTVNEATTVAAAYALAQFFKGTAITLGATATNGSGIALAAATAANLVDPATGAVPGAGFPATGTAPVAKIDSLANLLNACAVGGVQSGACLQLFTAAYGTAGKASNESQGETFGAVLSIAKSAGVNVAQLYALSQASAVYQPVLTATPPDWTLVVHYGGGGMSKPSAVAVDSTGKVWVANYNSVASLFSNTGVPVFAQGVTGNHLLESYGGAVDVTDAFWVANEESDFSDNSGLGSISVLSNAGGLDGHYLSGGFNFPLAVAFDTSGVAWVADYGNSSLTLLDASGNPLSGMSGYQNHFSFPSALATDAKCNAYVADGSSNTVTLAIADGSSFTDYTVGNQPGGVAVDAMGNVWTANYGDSTVGLVSDGVVLSGAGFGGGGLNFPQGIAADGAGSVWVANYRGPSLTELAGASASVPGAVLSPSAGWAADAGLLEAYALALDASGNLWVSNAGSSTLTEFVGLAVPVQTPLLGPVRVP